MQRELLTPRPGWQQAMEDIGFHFHTLDGTYWDESRCYRFTSAQVDELEAATARLHEMALNAAQQVVATRRFDEFAIPRDWWPAVEASFAAQVEASTAGWSLYGRMDFSYDGKTPPKLLEYNADTPTALLEASVAQWHWMQAVHPDADQFNSMHEKLIEAWKGLRAKARVEQSGGERLHFAAVEDSPEDQGNTEYLRDTALQAGWKTFSLPIERVGWNGEAFVDQFNLPIERFFKLYPWEWLAREQFGPHLLSSPMQVIEPAWKMLLSNKALLVVLWELYPNHPNLLPAYYEAGAGGSRLGAHYVRKPKLAREGANVLWVDGAFRQETDGDYGAEGFIHQAPAPLPRFGNDYVLVGSWIIGGEPAGIGLREDDSPITNNTSRFVPHYFVDV